jgi:hypothetical protein
VSLSFLSVCLFRLLYYADRNYASSALFSSSSAMVSFAGGAATEDSADPELIVSFGIQKGEFCRWIAAGTRSNANP